MALRKGSFEGESEMKKTLFAIVGSAALLNFSAASAAIDTTLHLDFASGATFDGVLTFSDTFDALIDVQGTLTGGSYGTSNINWAWWVGRGANNVAVNYDGVSGTYEDWLMDGTPDGGYANFIGISWYFPAAGALTLNLGADVYHAGVNSADRIVAYRVPEPAALALFGLGLLGVGLMRKRRASK
jgi:hypothetical protein